ncbi:MAG: hypothetical protein ACI8RD_012516, partial [Bacillariaceae sp.]|jgi:hypothetical protein
VNQNKPHHTNTPSLSGRIHISDTNMLIFHVDYNREGIVYEVLSRTVETVPNATVFYGVNLKAADSDSDVVVFAAFVVAAVVCVELFC